MAYNRNQARTLCTAAEYELFESSLSDRIGELTPARLRSKLERARKLRDKYRDLHKRQRLASRQRTGTKKGDRAGGSNERTGQKATLFAETLQRYTKQVEKLAAAEQRAAEAAARKAAAAERASVRRKTARGPAKAGSPKAGARGAAAQAAADTGFVSEGAKAQSRKARAQNTRARAVQGHVRAAGKRTQARRDRRR